MKKSKEEPKPSWTHPSPGEIRLLTVADGERVKRYRCDKAIDEKSSVALYAGERFVATVPKTSTFNYE